MKINGLLDHKHRPQGGCNLGDDCPAKEEKLVKVIKLDLNASGDCEGEEIDLKGDWCDLCLKLGPISVVGFTCLNEKCPNHGVGEEFPVYLCSICNYIYGVSVGDAVRIQKSRNMPTADWKLIRRGSTWCC